jgi:SET domain-containing protein
VPDDATALPAPAPTLPFEIRPSPIQGLGAFATRPIPAGTRLLEYAGERLTPEEAERRYPDVPGERHHTFLFALEDVVDGEDVEVVVDASVGGNEARFLNHSCAPNCDVVVEDARLWIETLRDVARARSSRTTTRSCSPSGHTPAAKRRYPCACGAAACRGTILARKRG